ncbi:MAG: endonuclease/exonuclease/phosphatase family protein [Pseudomonadota bacterium]
MAAIGPYFYAAEGGPAPLARLLELVSVWLLALGLVFGLTVLLLGQRRLGAGAVVLALIGGALLGSGYWRVTVPQADQSANLRVLFFNTQSTGSAMSDRIVAAAIAEAPDIAVFVEATGMGPALPQLRDAFVFVSPCPDEACEILVAANRPPERFWRLSLNPIWADRYGVIEYAPGQFFGVGHLVKPWFSGVAGPELERLAAQYNWLPESAVVVGDFNMPPWSTPMRRLLHDTGFRAQRGALGTWPAGAGPFALPIDQILTRGDVSVVSLRPFGEGLGSNHLGFVAELSVPGLPP